MKLIIINGPPGSGKSSVAEELHKTFPPLSCLIKLDGIRRLLKDRHENPIEAAELTFKIGQSMVDTCLKEGKDVVVERAFKDPAVVDQFIQVGKNNNADVFEFILWADKNIILDRNRSRGSDPEGLSDSVRVSDEKAAEWWEKINEIKGTRFNATVIDVEKNNLEQVTHIIQTAIS